MGPLFWSHEERVVDMNASSNKKGVVFLALILAVIVAAVVFIVVSLNSDSSTDSLKEDEIIATLFVLNDGDNNALATDVLLYYPISKKGALFSIPGNTGDIYRSLTPGSDKGRTDRIDAVYREQGIDAYNREIGKLLKLTIPFNIEISLDDFGLLTDLLGGMKLFLDSPVDITRDETNGASADDDSETNAEGEPVVKWLLPSRWLLPSGFVTLDGDKIQTYIEYSLPEEDDSDVENRRQTAMVAMLSALHEKRSVILEKKNFPLYSGKFKTNVTDRVLHKLLDFITNIDAETDRLAPQGLQGSLRTLPSGQTLLFPLFEGQLIKDIVKTASDNLINEGNTTYRYVLQVQNGTVTKGAATNATFLLKGLGNYDVLPASDADRSDYEHTVIINHMQSPTSDALNMLANFISCKNMEHRPSKDESGADFTIILGRDWDGRYVRGGYVNPEIQGQTENAGESAE